MDIFLPDQQTPILVFFNILLYVLIFFVTKKGVTTQSNALVYQKTGIFFILIFILFSFWGWDWFGHLESYNVIKEGGRSHMEDIYYWIAQNISPNYIIFRLFIWGSSFFLLLHIFRRLSVPYQLTLFLWSAFYLIWFSYARVSVAMVLICYALMIRYKPYRSKFFSIILFILAIGGSFFFHKSALFGIVVVLLSLFVTKFGRTTIILLLVSYPILCFLTQYFLNEFLLFEFAEEDSGNLSAGQRYFGRDMRESGWGSIIQSFLEKTPYYMLVLLSVKMLRSKLYYTVPNDIKAFMRLLFFIVFISSIFLFDLGVNTKIVYERFIRFAAIPASIVFCYFYTIKYNFNYIKFTYKLALCGVFYTLIYTLYTVIVS